MKQKRKKTKSKVPKGPAWIPWGRKRVLQERALAHSQGEDILVAKELRRQRVEAERRAAPKLGLGVSPPVPGKATPVERCIHKMARSDCRYCTPHRYGR